MKTDGIWRLNKSKSASQTRNVSFAINSGPRKWYLPQNRYIGKRTNVPTHSGPGILLHPYHCPQVLRWIIALLGHLDSPAARILSPDVCSVDRHELHLLFASSGWRGILYLDLPRGEANGLYLRTTSPVDGYWYCFIWGSFFSVLKPGSGQ